MKTSFAKAYFYKNLTQFYKGAISDRETKVIFPYQPLLSHRVSYQDGKNRGQNEMNDDDGRNALCAHDSYGVELPDQSACAHARTGRVILHSEDTCRQWSCDS